MSPLPPQAGPGPQPAPPGGDAPQPQQQGQKDPLSTIIDGVGDGLSKLQQIFHQGGDQVPPELVKQLDQVFEGYKGVVQALMQGGGQPQPQAPGQQVGNKQVPMEAGAKGVPAL